MENQKQVRILGLIAKNYGIIKAVELTPDLMQKRLVQVVGESGNGKSSLMRLLQIAVSGTDYIPKKDALEKGFITEALLVDGETKIYVGAKVTEYQRGEKAGQPKFETFMYSKDTNGKIVTPIVDGVAVTSSDYIKMLSTELTFNMPALFSANQTEHRKLIEKLFKPELEAMGIEGLMQKILEAKNKRDAARALTQNRGAYMTQFETEGYTEKKLSSLVAVDEKKLSESIFQKKLERDRMLHAPEAELKLAISEINNRRDKELQAIKDEYHRIEKLKVEKMQADTEAYNRDMAKHTAKLSVMNEMLEDVKTAGHLLSKHFPDMEIVNTVRSLYVETCEKKEKVKEEEPKRPQVDEELLQQMVKVKEAYSKLESLPLDYPEKTEVDTTAVDEEIKNLETRLLMAKNNNDLVERYKLWLDWIEKKGLYEKEIDTLRKMYASIDTGVPGLKVTAVEQGESGRIEVWMMYDGSYDTDFFMNPDKEYRYIFDYSSFQRSAIGLMLQAARLNLKEKSLRLAIIDDVAYTEKGLEVLYKISEDLNVQLFTCRTSDYDKDSIKEDMIIMEGGEAFFNKSTL
ncbi:hypothetical protein PF672P2_00033 [Parabacteroides phage PF672P2]|nr:hypothetical protein PF672P1_00071 [Parabacteroides phage PF672P1]WAX17170.1 hypothetical protein PF672P2_00033 [Parabacteroides phage PF672P2]